MPAPMYSRSTSTILVGLATLTTLTIACSTASQRTWSKHTHQISDDQEPKLSRANFDQARATAMGGQDSYASNVYAVTLVKFLWEVEPLFAAREGEKPKDSPAIAGLDREQLIAELEQHIEAIEAVHGYQPMLRYYVKIARKDCNAASFELALETSCDETGMFISSALDMATVACEEGPEKFCRTLHDLIPDHRHRYKVMRTCAAYVGGDPHEALAKWTTPEEIQFYDEMTAKLQAEKDEERFWLELARAGAANENAERMAAYEAERAAYYGKQSGIENVSEIGHLDPADGPPAAPPLITSVSIPLKERRYTEITDRATVVFQNLCEKPVEFGEADPSGSAVPLNPVTIGAGEVVSLELRRCSGAVFRPEGGSQGGINAFEPLVGVRLLEDCETEALISPEELQTLEARPLEAAAEGAPPAE
jgi:hypothetical protein